MITLQRCGPAKSVVYDAVVAATEQAIREVLETTPGCESTTRQRGPGGFGPIGSRHESDI